jgi:DNA-nicking Smr family endonuclease
MASRRRKKEAADDDRMSDAPFNNPFAARIRTLKRELAVRREARAKRSAESHAQAEDVVATDPVSSAADGSREQNEHDLFELAMHGTVAISHESDRVGRHRTAGHGPSVAIEDACDVDPTSPAHFDVRFSDQFMRGRADGVSRETLLRLERGEFAVRSHVDLHGMLLEDARKVVDDFLADCHRRGERCVLVITGKGRNSPRQVGILRENIPAWLARGPSSRRW